MRGRSKAVRNAVLVAAAGLLLASCGRGLPQNTLEPDGPISRKIDSLFWPVFWIAVVVFFLVEGLLVVALVKFRHRPGAPVPKQIHGNRRLELGWTVGPSLLLAGVAVFTIPVIFQVASRPAGNVLEITVTGHQWWWEVQYPGLNVITANEVHIPIGRPVYFTLKSNDVIHSFWIPRLAGKQDLEPSHEQHLKLEAVNTGVYFGQCAEYCGLSHANMRLRLMAQTPSDFDTWVQQQTQPAQPPPPDVLAIMQRANVGCNGCHTIAGAEGFAGTVGPNLTHFAQRTTFAGATYPNDPDHLRQWIHDAPTLKPGSDMPSFVGKLSPDEVNALVAYLETLK